MGDKEEFARGQWNKNGEQIGAKSNQEGGSRRTDRQQQQKESSSNSELVAGVLTKALLLM